MDATSEEGRLSQLRPVLLTALLTSLLWLTAGGALLFTWRLPAPTAFEVQPPPATATSLPTPTTAPPTPTATPGPLVVEVAGAVRSPGIYELPAGSRVQQALEAAGGAAADADLRAFSLARTLLDGDKLYVPAQGETPPLPADTPEIAPLAARQGSQPPLTGNRIDINTASVEELQALPGIGPVTAQAIVDHRQANGPFMAIERIVDVKGIGEGTLAKIRELITVGE